MAGQVRLVMLVDALIRIDQPLLSDGVLPDPAHRGKSYNTTKDNLYNGLYATGTSELNTFKKNAAKNNTHFDLEDDSTGAGNNWTNNAFNTQNPPGLNTRPIRFSIAPIKSHGLGRPDRLRPVFVARRTVAP